MDNDRLWRRGHNLFDRIRKKSLAAQQLNNAHLDAQYQFEEACAKLLYNLSGSSAPFDTDAPYWIVPNALALSQKLGMDDAVVVNAILGE